MTYRPFHRRLFLKLMGIASSGLLGSRSFLPFSGKNKAVIHVPRDRKAIVIGAGMAGLGAAHRLREKGYHPVVLEARDRIGGRVYTRRDWGYAIDMGASWIEGTRGNPIAEIAEQHKLRTLATNNEDIEVRDFNGKLLSYAELEAYVDEFEALIDSALSFGAKRSDISLQRAIDAALKGESLTAFEVRLLQWLIVTTIEMAESGDVTQLLASDEGRDTSFAGDSIILPDGYDRIPQILASNVEIHLNTSVESIDYSDSPVHVSTNRGVFDAEVVIVTLPLGVLKTGRVAFNPPLPSKKQQAIQRMGMGLLNKIIFQFDEPLSIPNRQYFGHVSKTKGDFPVFINWQTVNDQPALMAFTAGRHAEHLETKSDGQIIDDGWRVLRTLFGNEFPKPLGVLRSRWMSDLYSHGSYSFVKVGASPDDYTRLASPVEGRILFAGEATNPIYPATVHGAYLSGVREADRLP